jgi:anti-anti-sigma factor
LASIVVNTYGPLTLRIEGLGDALTVRAIGALDISTAHALEHALLHAFEGPASSIALDLTELRFVDAVGQRVIVWAEQHAQAEPDRIRVAGSAGCPRLEPATTPDRSA